VAAATESTRAAALTHFEYLMGEFGCGCDEATTATAYVAPSTAAVFPANRPSRSAKPFPPQASIPDAAIDNRIGRGTDLTEMILRLDAAIEPYTRAIVLLVLMAVAAFAALLLSSEPESPRNVEPPLAQARPIPQGAAYQSERTDSDVESTSKAEVNRATERVAPTAIGPASNRRADTPPVATLSNEIRPAPPEAVADVSIYPSSDLPAHEAPQEARQHDSVPPTHSYK
jgi:hypothetical protein